MTDGDITARRAAGRAVRDLGHALVGRHAAPGLLDEVTATLDGLSARLDEGAVRSRGDSELSQHDLEPVADGMPMQSYDDRPFSGQASPWGIDLAVHRVGDSVEATFTLRAAHEGAPSRTHGGIVAGIFDDVFGFVLGILHQPAFTGELTVGYRRPTPLFTPLVCIGRLDRRDGRKLWISGDLVAADDRDTVIASASGLFITVDPSIFRAASQELPAPPT